MTPSRLARASADGWNELNLFGVPASGFDGESIYGLGLVIQAAWKLPGCSIAKIEGHVAHLSDRHKHVEINLAECGLGNLMPFWEACEQSAFEDA